MLIYCLFEKERESQYMQFKLYKSFFSQKKLYKSLAYLLVTYRLQYEDKVPPIVETNDRCSGGCYRF